MLIFNSIEPLDNLNTEEIIIDNDNEEILEYKPIIGKIFILIIFFYYYYYF